MDDQSFERWSAKLTALRKNRQMAIDTAIQQKADSFGPEEFFDLAKSSLEEVMQTWFDFEQKSWESAPPDDQAAAQETVLGEAESTVDFEAESIERDRASVTSRITWDQKAISDVEPDYLDFVEELRNKYKIKVKTLGTGQKKRVLEPIKPAAHAGYSGGGGGNGLGFFIMFLIGLLLGGGPSIYFMNMSKDSERKFQEDRSKILGEQRALSDNIAVLHDSYDKLAMGKIKNIPELETKISQIQSTLNDQRRIVNRDAERERERLMKKIPAGDRLDRALADVDEKKKNQLAALDKQQAAALDPLTKQRDVLKDLMAH